MKRVLVLASGEKDGGGSGFQELTENSRTGILKAEIAAVVSNHEHGGVRTNADKLKVCFEHFPLPREAEDYQRIVKKYQPDLVVLSGWIKLVKGLDPRTVINIHPGRLPLTKGMWGHAVHETMINAYQQGESTFTEVNMHFATPKYDDGPVFFTYRVHIRPDDDADSLAKRVNKIEHGWQSYITNLVLDGQIRWDGVNRNTLVVPDFVPRVYES